MGTRAGFPDLWLSVPRGGYHGLYIELKSKKGTQQDTQKRWETLSTEQGYKYVLCRSFEEFEDEIKKYFRCSEIEQ